MQIALIKYRLSTKDVCVEVDDKVSSHDSVVINTSRGVFIAKVVAIVNNKQIDEDAKFVRVATDKDLTKSDELEQKAKDNKEIIVNLFAKHNAEMKFVDAVYTLDDTKIVISFVCEERVDFRELVKELASELKTRIELRQVGIRDQAKKVGCLGICGKECCCKQYLSDFDKVSIKMAKTQNLSLNPTKISGTCGRLMCCLSFENDTYECLGKNCPKNNTKVSTPDGVGVVINNNILRQTCAVKIEKGDDIKIVEHPVSSVKVLKDNKGK